MDECRIAPDLLQSAVDTYHIAASAGLDRYALEQAISAALVGHERQVIEWAARVAERFAWDLCDTKHDDDAEVGASVALHWFAARLRKDTPPLASPPQYEPHDGDVAEVVLAGRVRTYQPVTCTACLAPAGGPASWSILDDRSGAEYHFLIEETEGLNVRVLATHKEDH